jgi:hypothetical protein
MNFQEIPKVIPISKKKAFFKKKVDYDERRGLMMNFFLKWTLNLPKKNLKEKKFNHKRKKRENTKG